MSKIRAGIIGWPVSHSLSPALHGYWLKQYGIDGEYVRLPAEPLGKDAGFLGVVSHARHEGFVGLNVTVPHKEAAFKLADRRDKAAQITGAVNLLVFDEDRIEGRNTDHVGLRKSLEESLGENALTGKTVILLGAGGAARGAILALGEMGVAQIHILNRHQERANIIARGLALSVKAKLVPGPLGAFGSVAGEAALLINSTSAGMAGHEKPAVELSPLPVTAAVLDIVYNPLETELLKQAAARGHQVIDGLGMLMHQAAPSFEAFFGVKPEVSPGLRAALIQAMHGA
jgi:shikimate dehydrogenase